VTNANFAPAPSPASQVKNFDGWARDLTTWIFSQQKLTLHRSAQFGQTSLPDEEERAFRIRVQQLAHEERDAAVEKLRQKYAPKIAALQERIRRATAAKAREAEQANRAKLDTVISLGSTLLGAFLGRKKVSVSSVGKAATTMRGVGRAMEQSGDVTRATETVDAIQRQLDDLDTQFRSETDLLATTMNPATEALTTVELRPSKSNITVRLVAIVWVPFAADSTGTLASAY
jgi:hypothetical protein